MTTLSTRKVQAVVLTKDPTTMSVRTAQAVVMTKDPGALNLRQAKGYAFQQSPPNIAVRQVKGYAFQATQQILPTGVTAVVALYQRINNNLVGGAGVTFSASNSTLGAPSPFAGTGGVNTQVTLSALVASGYSGSVQLLYRRVDLSLAFSGSKTLPAIPSATTVYAMLATINSLYSTNLVQTDLVDGPVAANAKFITLTAATTSYMFNPGSAVSVGTILDLATAAPFTHLLGFDDAQGNGPRPPTTLMLLHFDGTDGQTTTSDVAGHAVTMTGGARLASGTAALYGSTGLLVPGTGAVVSVPDGPDLRLTADWTIEFAYYPSTVGSTQQFLIVKNQVGGGAGARIIAVSGKIGVVDDSTNTVLLTSGAVFSTAQRHHVAVVKKGTVCTAYVNGVAVATGTSSVGFGNNTSPWYIGNGNYPSFTVPCLGAMDELRISNIARYSANFTPPTTPFTFD